MSSAYQTTPHIMKKRMQLSSAKMFVHLFLPSTFLTSFSVSLISISDDLLRGMTRHDFIGIVSNPGEFPFPLADFHTNLIQAAHPTR